MIKDQHGRLQKTLIGHYNYYGVCGNFASLKRYYYAVWKYWYRALKRRSQKGIKYEKYENMLQLIPLPKPGITHSEGWLLVTPGYLLRRAG